MDRLSVEKRLSLTYLIVAIAGAATSISTGIAWGHWYKTLDQCVDRNCSCIIYAKHTQTIFLGKHFFYMYFDDTLKLCIIVFNFHMYFV